MKKYLRLLITGSALALSGCATSHHANKWEYKTVRVSYDKTKETPFNPPEAGAENPDKIINAMAKDGWLVTGYNVDTAGGQWFLLKRRIK